MPGFASLILIAYNRGHSLRVAPICYARPQTTDPSKHRCAPNPSRSSSGRLRRGWCKGPVTAPRDENGTGGKMGEENGRGDRAPTANVGTNCSVLQIPNDQTNALRGTPGAPFWRRNYWEHVLRDDIDLNRIRQYIENNPRRWHEDQFDSH